MATIPPASLQALCNQAVAYHQKGQLADAERTCLQILQVDKSNGLARNVLALIRYGQRRYAESLDLLYAIIKDNPTATAALGNYGMVLMAAQRPAEALQVYDRFLQLVPENPIVLTNRGNALGMLGRQSEALDSFDRAIKAQPDYAEAHYNRSLALAELRRFSEALAGYDQAIALRPGFVEAMSNRANTLRSLGRHEDALAAYDKLLALQPRHHGGLYNRGVTLAEMDRLEEALAHYDQALAIDPDFPMALMNRGNLLRLLKRSEEALTSYDRIITLDPNNADAYFARATAFSDLGRHEAALMSYDRALKVRPDHPATLYNRGMVLTDLGRLEAALESYDKAVAANPKYAEAWNNRGIVLQGLRRMDDAVASFDRSVESNSAYVEALTNRSHVRWLKDHQVLPAMADLEQALALSPNLDYSRGDLLHLRLHISDWRDFDAEVAALDSGVRAGKAVVRPFVYQGLSSSPADLKTCSEIFARRTPAAPVEMWRKAPRSHKEIRVGYVSADFREQATAYLTAGLYEHHNRGKFKIFAFDSGVDDKSPMRARLEQSLGGLIGISRMTDAAAAQRIAAEGIDILINLNGYFGEPRTAVFAHKPAPIQVNYLGFPATLALPYVEYIIADRIVIPPGEEQFYTEKVARLPGSYQPNDNKRLISDKTPSRAACGLPESGFVFCNFNQSYKLLPETFAAWMRILKAVDGSVLWLRDDAPPFQDNLRRHATEAGVASERLIFAEHLPVADHLARMRNADLSLDSLPYNAHTTASDALWAGVPLLTCKGAAFPGRVAASLLTAAEMPELITETVADFEATAIALARTPERLRGLRDKLSHNRNTCALFDTGRYCRQLEQAYETMFDLWRQGKPPETFDVSPT